MSSSELGELVTNWHNNHASMVRSPSKPDHHVHSGTLPAETR